MDVDALVVGAGPAGLSAAAELRRLGVGRVLVADRETAPGGVPRHSWHTGFGLRDLRRVMTGPAYARALAAAAAAAGAEIRLGTTVTGWAASREQVPPERAADGQVPTAHAPRGHAAPVHELTITSARGVETVRAAAVLLATGCRERPRAARLVPGDRPAGVMTTGELQQRVYLNGERLPGRALVVGAEHVSFSAMTTLAHAGAEVVALVTPHERQQSYAAFRLAAAARWRVPVWTSTAVRRIHAGADHAGCDGLDGRARLAGVQVADCRTGAARFVQCEWVVFTGDWIPDHELARAAGLDIDPGTRGPAVDAALATSAAGVFAAGNLVHAAETADVAALSGRHAARSIAAALRADPLRAGAPRADPLRADPLRAVAPPAADPGTGAGVVLDAEPCGRIPVRAEPPLLWISPNVVSASARETAPPLGRFVLRGAEFRRLARLEARQDGRLLARSRPARLIPGRPVHLGAGWLARVDPAGGAVHIIAR